MTPAEFRAIRLRLGFTQAELAAFLDYGSPMRISEFERDTNPRPVPPLLARLMLAYDAGYRPADWPA
jgi:transcriptional regulator with XRE-family HTH domain